MEHKKIDRVALKGGLVISKAEAAERQLRTAIWLWFHDFDPVPIHGLASAALKVLWKLHDKHKTGFKTLRDSVVEYVREEYQKAFIEMLNETENFIKHADRDPLAFHTFNPEMTVFILIDAVESLHALNGSTSVETKAFRTWFVIKYPDLMTLPEDHEWAVAAKRLRAGPQLSKSEFFKTFGIAMEQARADHASRGHP